MRGIPRLVSKRSNCPHCHLTEHIASLSMLLPPNQLKVPSKKIPRFDGPDEAGPQRADGGAGPSGTAQKSTDNPLMQSTAEYSQIMLWVSEFLRHDPR